MVKKGQYTVLESHVDYENPYMKIHKKEMVYPNDSRGTYWVLERPGDCAIAVPLFPNNETILVGQYRVPIDRYSWEFPMGSVVGKNGIEAAQQELKEEAGITGNNWKELGEFYLANGYSSQKGIVFVVTDLEQGETMPEEHEFFEIKRVGVTDIHKMIIDGTIKDGPTISAYFYLMDYLKKL